MSDPTVHRPSCEDADPTMSATDADPSYGTGAEAEAAQNQEDARQLDALPAHQGADDGQWESYFEMIESDAEKENNPAGYLN